MTTISMLLHEKETNQVSEGEVIFREGDQSTVMYAVLEGQVDIYYQNQLIDTVNTGEIFGEMALISKDTRSATAVARTDCRLAAIDEKRFLILVQTAPYFAIQVMSVLVDRLRRTTIAKLAGTNPPESIH